jgi:hypothetical protein
MLWTLERLWWWPVLVVVEDLTDDVECPGVEFFKLAEPVQGARITEVDTRIGRGYMNDGSLDTVSWWWRRRDQQYLCVSVLFAGFTTTDFIMIYERYGATQHVNIALICNMYEYLIIFAATTHGEFCCIYDPKYGLASFLDVQVMRELTDGRQLE